MIAIVVLPCAFARPAVAGGAIHARMIEQPRMTEQQPESEMEYLKRRAAANAGSGLSRVAISPLLAPSLTHDPSLHRLVDTEAKGGRAAARSALAGAGEATLG